MEGTLLQQGLNLMSFGMGTVFVFLTVLVMATALMSRIIGRLFPAASAPHTGGADQPIDAKTLQIIQAALDQHRGRK